MQPCESGASLLLKLATIAVNPLCYINPYNVTDCKGSSISDFSENPMAELPLPPT